jgi:hypothetical protein
MPVKDVRDITIHELCESAEQARGAKPGSKAPGGFGCACSADVVVS